MPKRIISFSTNASDRDPGASAAGYSKTKKVAVEKKRETVL